MSSAEHRPMACAPSVASSPLSVEVNAVAPGKQTGSLCSARIMDKSDR
jgi:hypothetical protein